MSVSAYVLIQIEMGKAAEVAGRIRAIEGVDSAEIATGPYDVIARTTAPTMDDLGRMVVGQIEMVEGITRTLTCPIINL
jgi:DNA-binding Lrp family transcriptional regulator